MTRGKRKRSKDIISKTVKHADFLRVKLEIEVWSHLSGGLNVSQEDVIVTLTTRIATKNTT